MRRAPAEWEWTVEVGKLRAALAGNRRVGSPARVDRVEVEARDEAGRALWISLGRSTRVRGADFRTAVAERFGPRSLASTMFEVRQANGQFVFRGAGAGHGAGLCQAGALARAEAGESVESIVRHYFPGTRIGPVPAGTRAARSGE
jgi:SpoIID/LytB domain protein